MERGQLARRAFKRGENRRVTILFARNLFYTVAFAVLALLERCGRAVRAPTEKMQILKFLIFASLVFVAACPKSGTETPTNSPSTLGSTQAVRLNYRFEADVPPPMQPEIPPEELNATIQTDFSTNRLDEILVKTIVSPDKQRILVVYRRTNDAEYEFRVDMYAADGRILRKVTYDGMAVYYPGAIIWSPDSKSAAFMAKVRGAVMPNVPAANSNTNANTSANTNANTNINANANTASEPVEPSNTSTSQTPFVEGAKAVLTLRTEQVYICGADGEDVKLLTQKEGLIYFYFVWSPDSTMLVALAATYQEWQVMQFRAKQNGEFFLPFGRPRLIEKNGRERLLDDFPTNVYPVWSSDSTKIAVAYDKTIKIYDALGTQPTQAAIPLQYDLLASSKKHKETVAQQEQSNSNTNADANANVNTAPTNVETNTNQLLSTDIDEDSKVWFNPIVDLKWTEPNMLYLQTGYQKLYENPANNVRSYFRWHRLIFSPQAIPTANQK